MSLVADALRAAAGTELQSHKLAIEFHVEQIKMLKEKINVIKTNFPDDADEINTVLSGIAAKVATI